MAVKIHYNLDEIIKAAKDNSLEDITLIDDLPISSPLENFCVLFENSLLNKKYSLYSLLTYDGANRQNLRENLCKTFGNQVSPKGEGILYNNGEFNLSLIDITKNECLRLRTSYFNEKEAKDSFGVFFNCLEKIIGISERDLKLNCEMRADVDEIDFGVEKGETEKNEFKPISLSGYSFKNIGGQKEAVYELKKLSNFFKNTKVVTNWGYRFPRGILLYGPSGTGKTLLAKTFSCQSDCTFYSINIAQILSKWVGESERSIQKLFDEAAREKRSVVFLDELDALMKNRNSVQEYDARVVNVFLECMDGFDSAKNVIILGATNYKDCIDEALLRPGRFDKQIKFTYPDFVERKQILKIHQSLIEKRARRKIFEDSLPYEKIARILDSKTTGADIEGMFNKILEKKIIKEIKYKKFSKITEEDILNNLPKKGNEKAVGFLH